MTLQEMLNKVWKHSVIDRNPPSMNDDNDCVYRGENGEACFIGVFIPKSKYTTDMEGNSISTLYNIPTYSKLMNSIFGNISVDILHDLQDVHDISALNNINSHNQDYLFAVIAGLTDFSEKYNLITPQI